MITTLIRLYFYCADGKHRWETHCGDQWKCRDCWRVVTGEEFETIWKGRGK